jgi:hypothetical protein
MVGNTCLRRTRPVEFRLPQTLIAETDGQVVIQCQPADDGWLTLREELPRGERGNSPFSVELLVEPRRRAENGQKLGAIYCDMEWAR